MDHYAAYTETLFIGCFKIYCCEPCMVNRFYISCTYLTPILSLSFLKMLEK